MTLNLTVTPQLHTDFSPRITVIGVGGGGTNAVDNMIAMNLQGVEFVVANTDAQQLVHSRADRRIQLGPHITQGLGAGAKPEIGRAAAEEAADELYRHLDGAHMAFITAGMGGGTGTGAAPVIARMARERGILTVGVVTKPFTFEGSRRARAAEEGIIELTQFVDTLIVIPNQNLFRLANERTGWKEAFKMADNVLYMGVRGVTDLMVAPGMVNLDFADIRTVMAEMGKAMMGTGEAEGENRAIRAAEAAISNPLLEDTCMAGARGLLINITGGEDMTLFEVDQAANRIREEVDEDANIIFGSAVDENLNGKVRVSVVATGIESAEQMAAERPRLVAVGGGVAAVATQAAPGPSATHAAPQPAAMRTGPAPSLGHAQRMPMPQPRPLLHTSSQSLSAQPLPQPSARLTPAPAPAAAPAMAEEEPQQAAQPQAYDMDLDEPLAPPRQIPPHLQQPLRPLAQGQKPRASARAGSGLFAEPPRGEHAAPPPRRSLFGIVTGAIRSSLPAASAPAEAPSAPAYQHDPSAQGHAAEPVRANVRPAMGEEMGIDIPAFLRRQSS
ncbi:MAG TPA: cell division protein FtsZ [Acetobacteraceae bacterium]|jgi:cell division protein FtsZ